MYRLLNMPVQLEYSSPMLAASLCLTFKFVVNYTLNCRNFIVSVCRCILLASPRLTLFGAKDRHTHAH